MINRILLILFSCINLICAKNLNVLVLSVGRFPPIQGTAVLNHITGLIDLGCDIHIYAYDVASYINSNKDIIYYDLLNKLTIKNMPENLEQYDVILGETGSRGHDFLKYKSEKTKLVTCFRGSDVGRVLQKNPLFYDELFKKGELFLPVCNAFKQKLMQYGCPEKKIKVLHSSIDCNIFYYKKRDIKQNEPIKIISVCRLVPKKGLEYAIEAVQNLINQGMNIKYTIVGEGDLRKSLQKLIIDFNMQNYITIIGRKDITAVVKYLHESHIFVLPAIKADDGDEEGIPNAAKEAMACGLPVILTDHSGNSELVTHNVSGLLIEQKSVKALEDALRFLIDNKQLWNKFGKVGREKIEKDFEKNQLSKKLYDLLNEVVQENA